MTRQPHRSLSLFSVTALTVAVAMALTSCTSGETTTDETLTTTMTRSPETTTASPEPHKATAGSLESRGASVESTSAEPKGEWNNGFLNVRTGAHEGYDRVVFEFAGDGVPGWFAGYTDEPRQPGSGYPIEYTGDTALGLNLNGIGLEFETGYPDLPIGPVAGAEPTSKIASVVHAGVFEGQAHFAIGINGEPTPYVISTLENPTRVVVDIEN